MDGQEKLRDGVCIRGCVLSEVGLGQAARNLGLAVEAAGIDTNYLNISLPGRNNAKEFAGKLTTFSDQRTTIHVFSAVRMDANPIRRGDGRKNILYPFWELAAIPSDWLRNIEWFDEVWAPSEFIAEAFRKSTSVPVIYMPQPVPIPVLSDLPARPRDRFVVLTYLDVDSYVERKNLSGALNAFMRAFPEPSTGTEIWVKIRGQRDSGIRQSMTELTKLHPRIRLIDETISRAEMDALLLQCDVLLSLHRSEGFGLGAAEALALEKAVVATDYSGTKDFINPQTAYPVAYDMIRVEHDEYVEGTEGQFWADPSIDDAVSQLTLAHADIKQGQSRGPEGRKFVERQHSPRAVGARIVERLSQIW